MKKSIIFWVGIGVVALAVIAYGSLSRSSRIVESTPTPSPSPSTEEGFRGMTGLREPGSCHLTGEIDFIAKNTYEVKDAKISWANIDIESRNIEWTVTPRDDLSIGPNIFVNQQLPNGSQRLVITLPQSPIARSYILTAKTHYGQIINGNVVLKDAICTGQVKVNLKY